MQKHLFIALIPFMILAALPYVVLSDFPQYNSNPFEFSAAGPLFRFGDHFFAKDLNGDGYMDFVYRTESAIYAYDHYGSQMWNESINIPFEGANGSTFCAADVDEDGQVEIVAVNDASQLIVYNGSSGNIEGSPIDVSVGYNQIATYIAVVNLRGQGDRDVIVQTTDIHPEESALGYYINRTLIAYRMDSRSEYWRVEQDDSLGNGYYEGYWGQAHGGLMCADVDGDGLDEVIGGNLIDNDGTVINIGYPTNWLSHIKNIDNKFIDHLDAIAVGDLRLDLPGLEWVVTQEDHAGGEVTDDWSTGLVRYNLVNPGNGVIWREETSLFPNNSQCEPQDVAVGNFNLYYSFDEVWNRSRMGDDSQSQHPWLYDANGYQFSHYASEDVLPSGFNTHDPAGNKMGLECIWTIDWAGSKKEYIAATTRDVDGNVGVFDAVTGQAVWTTIDMVPQIQAHVIYVADVSGDNREEIVIYDKADETIKIFWNEEENPYQPKPDKWDDPLYRRVKQNWSFYSPGHYTMNDYPVISNVTISDITTNGSTIYWETDEASSSQVAYGLTESYGYETDLDTAKTTVHSVRISGLNPDTQYHFQTRSWNVYDKQGMSRDSTFTSDIPKKLNFITPSHTIYQGVVSPVITVEVQDLDENPRDVHEDVVILLSTDSQAGEFSLDPYNWSADTSVTIYTGTSSAQFYYKDSNTGTPTITAAEIPDHGWSDGSQQHTIVIAGSLHEPHLVYGTVKTSGNQIPQDGDLTYQAFIETRPAEKLTESSAACGYSGGTWWVECANFQSGWTAVEVIQIEFTDSGSGETGAVEVTLTVSTADDAGQVDLSLDSPEITGLTVVGNTQLKLTWTSAPGVSGYNVYRGTTAYFTPDIAGGSNRIGSQVNDQDPGTSGVQWTDASNVVGDWQVNYFYVVTSVNINGESSISNRVGEFDYQLITTASTNFNLISLPLDPLDFSLTSASELMALIPLCDAVAHWGVPAQAYDQMYVGGGPQTDFDVFITLCYYVSVTQNTVFTLLGEVVSPSFQLQTTQTTDFNWIMLPLDKGQLAEASDLMGDISACNSVAWWNADIQGYGQYISNLPVTDFDVQVGYPYFVNVTGNVTWPEQGPEKSLPLAFDFVSGNSGCQVPHSVWGRLAGAENLSNEFHFKAFIASRPHEVLHEDSHGCMLEGSTWVVQCDAFPTPWKAGERLRIQFNDSDGAVLGIREIVLTYQPDDRAEDIVLCGEGIIPNCYKLSPNYPNPFNAGTRINYQVPERVNVSLRVYNLMGQEICSLVDGEKDAGFYETVWDGKDRNSMSVGSGTYLLSMRAGEYSIIRKMLLIQ